MGDQKECENVKNVWSRFYEIFNNIKAIQYDKNTLKSETKDWLDNFYLKTYQKASVRSVYIHIFVHHLHEFIDLYPQINKFTTQGIEKLNDKCSGFYFKGCNKRGQWSAQILKKINRIEHAR
jgi:hypothetical protein